jgi:hypothetical protein
MCSEALLVKVGLYGTACLLLLLPPRTARADAPCKERCEARREKVKRQLEECLRDVDPRPRDRAAKMRIKCRQHYVPPRCDGLPSCKELRKKKPAGPPPGMKLGRLVFSSARRGQPLSRPRYAAGSEVFLRLEARVVPRKQARRVFLELGLRMLRLWRTKKGEERTREVVRWDSYAREQRVLGPGQHGVEHRFTLHGGAKLPPEQKPGTYVIEAVVHEKGSGFEGRAQGRFTVTPAPVRKKKK